MIAYSRRFFISYRRDDVPSFTQRLHDELERRYGGKRVFLDRADIEHGMRWRENVDDAVAASDVVIAVIGPRWHALLRERDTEHDVLCHELATALRLRKDIVPVLVDGTTMPEAAQLPHILRDLAEIQALPVATAEFDRGLRELLGILKPPWSLALAWTLANLAALLVGALMLVFGLQALNAPETTGSRAWAIAVGALFGLVLALPQWFVLRHWFRRVALLPPAYAVICAVGIGAGAHLGMAVAVIAMLMLPPLWGVATWLAVRGDLVSAGWWALFNAVAPFAGLMLAAPASTVGNSAGGDAVPILIVFAIVPQFLSGVLLVWLMRRARMRPLLPAPARPSAGM